MLLLLGVRARIGLALALSLLLPSASAAREQALLETSPINGRPVVPPPAGEAYDVWIAGHSYGPSIYPVASLLANTGVLQNSGARALFLLGDTMRAPTPLHREALSRFTRALPMPVFIAPGNHELRDPGEYEAAYGPVSYALRIGADLYAVFFVSLHGDVLPADEIARFRDTLAQAERDDSIRNVVILTHHLVWAMDDPRLEIVRSHVTFPPDYRTGYFAREMWPAVTALAARKPVVWLSGDRTQFPPFYWKVPEHDVRFVASGLAGREDDAIVKLHSDPRAGLTLSLFSLSGRDLGAIEQYGPDYWQSWYEGPGGAIIRAARDVRFVRARMFVTHRRFVVGALVGAGAALLVVAALALLRRRT